LSLALWILCALAAVNAVLLVVLLARRQAGGDEALRAS
jgi:hypothetical protein